MKPEPDSTPNPSNMQNLREYRARLLQKLNCLIAVLQVAIAKVRRNLEAPSADLDRLTRIRTNLEKTLSICRKAKASLESSKDLPADLPAGLSSVVGLPTPERKATPPQPAPKRPKFTDLPPGPAKSDKMSYRHYVEFSSLDEFKKFRDMPAIDRRDVEATDIDELVKRLQEG